MTDLGCYYVRNSRGSSLTSKVEVSVGDILQYADSNTHTHYYDIQAIDNISKRHLSDWTWYSGAFFQIFLVLAFAKTPIGHRVICLIDTQGVITWAYIQNLSYMIRLN